LIILSSVGLWIPLFGVNPYVALVLLFVLALAGATLVIAGLRS
jgi:hypothetical protein